MVTRHILRAYRDAFSGLPRDLWLLALVALVNRAGTMVLPFMTLYLTAGRGLTVNQAGQIVGLYGIGSVMGSYVGGWLSDRVGAIRTLQGSLVLGGAGFLVLGAVRGRWAIAVAMLVVSLVVDAFRPAVLASFSERASPHIKARAFALLRLANNLGFGIGPALGGFLALRSYAWLFLVDAATCWMAAILLAALPTGRAREAASDEGGGGPPRAPWRDGLFLVFLVAVVALSSALFQIFSTLPLYFREHIGLRENAIGLLLSLNAFLIVAFEMVLIHAVRNRDRLQVAAAGALLLCVGFALVPFGSTFAYMALTVAVWTFGEMLALPMLNVIAAERAGRGYEGQYLGMYTVAYSTAFIVAPLAGTFVYERLGPRILWYGIGGLGVVLWLALLALRQPFREPRG